MAPSYRQQLQIGLVVFLDERIDLLREVGLLRRVIWRGGIGAGSILGDGVGLGGGHLAGEIFAERDLDRLGPFLVLPQFGSDESLGAVEETFAHGDSNRELRRRAARGQPLEND